MIRVLISSRPAFIREALFGIGLSYGLTSPFDTVGLMPQEVRERLEKVALNLAWLPGGGHNKFLESITMALDIRAPRYWWQEFDTYRVGMTKQSESTIHTITKRKIEATDFEELDENSPVLKELNALRENYIAADARGDNPAREAIFRQIKNILPEGYKQRRIVVTNAMSLKNMLAQRSNHRLKEWHDFRDALRTGLGGSADGEFIRKCIFAEDRPETEVKE